MAPTTRSPLSWGRWVGSTEFSFARGDMDEVLTPSIQIRRFPELLVEAVVDLTSLIEETSCFPPSLLLWYWYLLLLGQVN